MMYESQPGKECVEFHEISAERDEKSRNVGLVDSQSAQSIHKPSRSASQKNMTRSHRLQEEHIDFSEKTVQ
jgi:hypothetical protein